MSKPLAIGKFWDRRTPPVGPDYVTLRVYDGQENLHIDGEYAIHRRTDGPERDRLLEDLHAEILRWHERHRATRDVIRRLRDGWEPDTPCIGPEVWCWFHPDSDEPEPMTEAERAVIEAAKEES